MLTGALRPRPAGAGAVASGPGGSMNRPAQRNIVLILPGEDEVSRMGKGNE